MAESLRPTPDTPEFRAGVAEQLRRHRQPEAPAPRPEALADAYLGMLKLVLCDLTTAHTMTVERTVDGVGSSELSGFDIIKRTTGSDWPLYGLSMAGLARLDDLEACVRSVVADGVEGDLIEAGTWRGGASMLMRAALDTLGDDRTVFVADSFSGFREDLRSEDLAALDFLAVSLEDVRANFARFGLDQGVEFVPGYFEETMEGFGSRPWAICRLDGDSYEATKVCLDALYGDLSVGGYLIVDDYFVLEECRAAVDEFRAEHDIDEPIEQVDWTCARWRRASPAPVPRRTPAPSAAATLPPRPRPAHTPVPASETLTLRREVEELRAEVDRHRRAPHRRLGRAVGRAVGRRTT